MALVLCGVVAVAIFALGHREPHYEGRLFSAWFTMAEEGADKVLAIDVVKRMGPDALPWLTDELHAHDSVWKLRFIQVVRKFGVRWDYTDANERKSRAMRSLELLGPIAKPAMPKLLTSVQGNEYSHFAIFAYKICGEIDPDLLIAELGSSVTTDRMLAKAGLQSGAWKNRQRIVPLLTAAMTSHANADVRFYAAESLSEITGDRSIVLRASLTRPNREKYSSVINREITRCYTPKALALLIMPFLDDADPEVRCIVAGALGRCRSPNTTFATSALRSLHKDPDPQVRDAAENALVAINPTTLPTTQE